MELRYPLGQVGFLVQQPPVALVGVTGEQHGLALLVADKCLRQQCTVELGDMGVTGGGVHEFPERAADGFGRLHRLDRERGGGGGDCGTDRPGDLAFAIKGLVALAAVRRDVEQPDQAAVQQVKRVAVFTTAHQEFIGSECHQ